jgi:O-antigen ligase
MQSPALRVAAPILGVALLTVVVALGLAGRELPLLLVGAASLFCLWLFRNPHWGVLAIFAFWFTRFSPVLMSSSYLSLAYIFSALLCVPFAFRLLRDREVWVWSVPQVRFLLAIGAIFLVSTLWADYKYPVTFFPELDRTAMFTQDFIKYFIFLVFFLYFVNTPRKIQLAFWLAVGLIVASVASAYMTLFSVSTWRRANAAFGIGTNPTSFPYVALFGASLLWAYYSAAPTRRWKGWVIPLLITIPVMAMASGSRTGLLQLLVFGTLVFRDQSGGWSRTKRLQGVLLLACVAVLVSILVPAIAVLRSTTFAVAHTGPGGQSLTDRVNTLYAGLSMVAADPIFGVGLGNFLWMHAASYGLNRLPHNSILWALAEGGIGVLVLYVLLFYATYRMLRRLEVAGPPDLVWLAKGFRFNLVLLMVFALSDDVCLTGLFYLILAATGALARVWQLRLQAVERPPARPAMFQRRVEAAR